MVNIELLLFDVVIAVNGDVIISSVVPLVKLAKVVVKLSLIGVVFGKTTLVDKLPELDTVVSITVVVIELVMNVASELTSVVCRSVFKFVVIESVVVNKTESVAELVNQDGEIKPAVDSGKSVFANETEGELTVWVDKSAEVDDVVQTKTDDGKSLDNMRVVSGVIVGVNVSSG